MINYKVIGEWWVIVEYQRWVVSMINLLCHNLMEYKHKEDKDRIENYIKILKIYNIRIIYLKNNCKNKEIWCKNKQKQKICNYKIKINH